MKNEFPPPSLVTVARTLGSHVLSLLLPGTTLAFLATGPHPWYGALPFFGVVVVAVMIDQRSPADRRPPAAGLPALPFDALLGLLAAGSFANVYLTGRLVAEAGLLSADALVAVLLVGVNTAYSSIVVAHELIHRPSRAAQLLGRALMVTALYEHFTTEHVRGHHARIGTDDDPATARFGEAFGPFLARTIPAQWRSAWTIEQKRLGHEGVAWYDPRTLENRVAQGLLVEAALVAALAVAFGPAAAIVFALQAAVSVLLLEAVNYFEHWGLRRVGRRVRPVDSWDTDSWFTLHALVGLSRHADHHAYAARPYQELRLWDESPKLPRGYLGMVVLVLFRNDECRALLTAELERVRLGPFAEAQAA
jgi:alkane 1-monooxygenase